MTTNTAYDAAQTTSSAVDNVSWLLSLIPTEMIPLPMTIAKYPGVKPRTACRTRSPRLGVIDIANRSQNWCPILRQRRPLVPGSLAARATWLRKTTYGRHRYHSG